MFRRLAAFALLFALLPSHPLPIEATPASPPAPIARPPAIVNDTSGPLTINKTVLSASGANTVDIQTTVDQFRVVLGNNNGVGGTFVAGRREINWDGVPNSLSAPNVLTPTFFNVNSPRGVVFSTPGTGFMVSSILSPSLGTVPRFENINPLYSSNFRTFSAERLFTPLGSNQMDVDFFVPGSTEKAIVRGFGAVFSDVELAGAAKFELFSGVTSLGIYTAPAAIAGQGFSFVGVDFGFPVISKVRITSGQGPLGAGLNDVTDGGTLDLVVMDDFIYGEPVGAIQVLRASGGSTAVISPTLDSFRSLLGPINPNTPGSKGGGQRIITWDGVPDSLSSPNMLPGDFFNITSTRGVNMTTPGTGFQVSAKLTSTLPVEFGTIEPTYATTFRTFSPERLFTPIGSNITDIEFFIPGTIVPGVVRGFGVVFSDVDNANSTTVEYFSGVASLGVYTVTAVPGINESLTFLGVDFRVPIISRVRITSGSGPLGPGVVDVTNGGTVDVVAMDDFIVGEPSAAAANYSATGGSASSIQSAVDSYRAAIGPLNANTPGSVGSGRRELNWDGIPDELAAPNVLPNDYFNNPVSPRGVLFTGPISGVQVSAKQSSGIPVRFGHITNTYTNTFRTFSPERLMAPIGSNQVEMQFVVPGTPTPARVRSFGVVFSDVDRDGSSAVEFFSGLYSIGTYSVPAASGQQTLSFIGFDFGTPVVSKVRITAGDSALGPNIPDRTITGTVDLVVLDDFIFSEPLAADLEIGVTAPDTGYVAVPFGYSAVVTNTGTLTATNAVVTASLSVSMTLASATFGCLPNGSVLSCPLGTMGIGVTRTLTFTVVPTQTGVVASSFATIADTELDPATNTVTKTTTILARAVIPNVRKLTQP